MDQCPNAASHHPRFIPFPDLDLSHLPEKWRHRHVLDDLQDIARRVVKLRVRKKSADRFRDLPDGPEKKRKMRQGHHGTGFVTYDRRKGALVHTSKHVVFDPFEAQHTDVIFFCDREDEGVKCQGIPEGFRSVWAMDYSFFTLQRPLPSAVATLMEQSTERTFSWRVFSLSRLLYRQSRDVDVVIISHPHGSPKKVSVGKMSRRHNMTVALYTAATCPGSSGAPVVRLSDDYRHYVAAGQFVHHGYDRYDDETATAIGSLRPPVTFPYFRFLDVGRIRRVVALLYEPVSYWALYATDFLEVEGVLFHCTDNFCYFLTLYGFFSGWQDPWTARVFWAFLVVVVCQMAVYARRGARFAVLHLLHLLQALAMHWVTWLVCFLVPRDYQSLLWVAPLWVAVLGLSRHVSLERLLGLDLFHSFLKARL
ncbi:uncharacterized protein LOC143288129 [Babylonia areolata]|uniref:uncharacterized protein LOC143288129 n=1 Tax=Babylonia areolata TaxID=304850 RepID=UPI003FD2112B